MKGGGMQRMMRGLGGMGGGPGGGMPPGMPRR
jgi:signal recognition particle subunit SRP54